MRLRRVLCWENACHPQRQLAGLGQLTQADELPVLAGVAADGDRVERDAAFLLPLEAAYGDDLAAVAHHRDDQLVQQGCVTLEGRVEWIYQREEAEAAVRRLPGVRGVINAIALAPCVAPAAAAIEEAIRKTLARHAGPDGCGLTVDVVGGEVTLRGWVGSRDERSVAEQCARATYGVQTVRNELSIRSEGAAAKNYA